ncbi:stage II sporulation protein R [Ferdinandcohnia quinoae]|uniref:Stage II sporulation protein R n=1 Tax=Fredinandcohnia quinoae TaxID=2918902 RepID=A0AAW5DYG5_9BACI|nr:stage II sporulation protein R [Fredinandcohnia sp. SECRCQ15]MCH1625123.1 stage II sporulation protein R [Fredinandcohnia sp. SECRCQ15]
MRKQYAIIFFILLLFIGANSHLFLEKTNASGPTEIPDEAIRLRILANSDSDEDQALKRLIRDEVNKEITKWVEKLTSVEAARTLIQERLPEIEEIVKDVLENENSNQTFSVKYGSNVSFPTKLYGEFLYPAGNYEAILISLGEAKGANWWCVLFPPLCFLDFSNGEAVDTSGDNKKEEKKVVSVEKQEDKKKNKKIEKKDEDEVEVRFFLVDFFTSLFS